MQVFFSWSGEASRLAAQALAEFVSEVIQAVDPWLSEAIAKGAQWREQLNLGLEQSRIGVCCLTQENVRAEWILFEAGAIAKTKGAHLCTFLLDLKPADVSGPLSAFQHTVPEKEDVKKLMRLINTATAQGGEKALTENQLAKTFEKSWPDLHRALAEARGAAPEANRPRRSERELLEEVLELVRQLAQYSDGVPPGDKIRLWQRAQAQAAPTTTAREMLKHAHRQQVHEQLVLEEPELGLHSPRRPDTGRNASKKRKPR